MSQSPDNLPRKRLGDFEIIDEVGRGGMGVVYRARELSLNREVALKVLTTNFTLSPSSIERFKREAAAAARLRHPHIVPVYSNGEDGGLHYFAMELVDGQSLDKVIRQMRAFRNAEPASRTRPAKTPEGDKTVLIGANPVPPPADSGKPLLFNSGTRSGSRTGGSGASRGGSMSGSELLNAASQTTMFSSGRNYFDTLARLVADVADGLHYAHQEGVIHRDIKPGNLILSNSGRIHIGDFGLARLMEEPGLTMSGGIMGSPHYMSPEQLSLDPQALDHRTDVYSLGVTLYELLTLQTPFKEASAEQILSQIISKEPRAPRKINRQIPQDLETICLKAMEKSPARRYQTAGELADDLRRYANRFSISARPITLGGRAMRWSQRHPAGAGLVVSVVVLAITLAGLRTANQFRRTLQTALDAESRSLKVAEQARQGEADARKNVESLKNFLDYSIRINDANRALEADDGPRALQILQQIQEDPALKGVPGFEWRYLWNRSQEWHGRNIWAEQPGWKLSAAAFSNDDTRLALSGSIKIIRVFYGMPNPNRQIVLSGHTKWVNRVVFSPDDKLLASASDDRTVRLWDMTVDPPVEAAVLEGHTDSVYEVKFSHDGRRLVSCSRDGTLRLWDVAGRKLITTLRGHEGGIWSVAFSADGQWIASAGVDGTVRLWEASGTLPSTVINRHTGEVLGVDFSSDGRWLASCDDKGYVRLTNMMERREVVSIRAHKTAIFHIGFSPDGTRLASSGLDNAVKLWSVPQLDEIKTLRGHLGMVFLTAFSTDGRGLVSASIDGSAKLWDLTSLVKTNFVTTPGHRIWSATATKDGKLLVDISTVPPGFTNKVLRLWKRPVLQPPTTLTSWTNEVIGLQAEADFSADGKLLASCNTGGEIRVWNAQSGSTVSTWKTGPGEWRGVRFSPNGELMAAWGTTPEVQLIVARTGEVRHRCQAALSNGRGVVMASFSPDGRKIATLGMDHAEVQLWDVESGSKLATMKNTSGATLEVLAFSPGSQLIAAGDIKGRVSVWNVAEGNQVAVLDGHVAGVKSLAFTPDGHTLVSAASDSTLAFWNMTLNQRILRLDVPPAPGELTATGITSIHFKADEREMVTTDGSSRIQFWPAPNPASTNQP